MGVEEEEEVQDDGDDDQGENESVSVTSAGENGMNMVMISIIGMVFVFIIWCCLCLCVFKRYVMEKNELGETEVNMENVEETNAEGEQTKVPAHKMSPNANGVNAANAFWPSTTTCFLMLLVSII
eukprot:TRINITY_DN3353_c0_g1_i1.p1 TRINITY_DN3353_c0_g1~~TRINITY_DN3353_c0_g1_i1.p1  ORF type:complete len:136 (+),score=46.49 TRINITY_DN3353_c0_g1_i1:35-409(+)